MYTVAVYSNVNGYIPDTFLFTSMWASVQVALRIFICVAKACITRFRVDLHSLVL